MSVPWHRRPLRWWGVLGVVGGFALVFWLVQPYGPALAMAYLVYDQLRSRKGKTHV